MQQTIVEGDLQSVLVAHHDVTNRTPRVLQVSWDENFIPFLSPKRKPLQAFTCKGLEKLVGRAGVEPATLCLKVREHCILQRFIRQAVLFNLLIIKVKNVNPPALSSAPQGSKRVAKRAAG